MGWPLIRGTDHGQAKLTDDTVRKIRARLLEGAAVRRLSIEYGVDRRTIYDVKSGRTWKHVQAGQRQS